LIRRIVAGALCLKSYFIQHKRDPGKRLPYSSTGVSGIPARGTQVSVSVKEYVERHYQSATAVTGFVHFLRINRDDLHNEALSEAHEFQLLRDLISAVIEDDGFLDVIEKAHVHCVPAKILAIGVADSYEQGICGRHLVEA